MRLIILLGIGLLTAAPALRADERLPALTKPATMTQHPGKFVWADVFSNNVEATGRFYEQLFGWELRWISEPPDPYGIFSLNGSDVAGLGYRDVEGEEPYSRWVHYLSVADTNEVVKEIGGMGGRTLLSSNMADRGEFAIFSSSDDVLLGVVTSSSGDPDDVQSLTGEWIWRQLYVWDLDAAVAILGSIAPFEVEQADESEHADRLLSSGGYARAGITELTAGSAEAPTWIGFIRVADVAAMTARALQLGGRVLFEAEGADMTLVGDPGGAIVGLVEYAYPDVEDTP